MHDFLVGEERLLIYFIIAATVALACRVLIDIPNEVFRKVLHCILLGSLLIFIFAFPNWYTSAIAAIVFAVIVYPVLIYLEHFKNFSKLTTERKKGELKTSLLLVFAMFAIVITICWGWLGDKYLVLASIYAWGFGDAAAALIGKKFGKHKINWKFIDGKKSMEGSIAMFITSLVTVAVIFACRGGINFAGYIIIPIVTAIVSTFAELYSKDGMDTVICPISAMVVVVPLTYLFGGLI